MENSPQLVNTNLLITLFLDSARAIKSSSDEGYDYVVNPPAAAKYDDGGPGLKNYIATRTSSCCLNPITFFILVVLVDTDSI